MTTRAQRRADLAADVKSMRELGVLRWGSVWLGPAPATADAARPLTAEEIRKRALDAEQRRHDTLFAASSVKPLLRPAAETKAEEDQARLSRVVGAKK